MNFTNSTNGQNVSFGITFKPIIPDNIFNLTDVKIEGSQWKIDINQRISPTFGMLVKAPISKFVFLEIGLLYVSRKFTQNINFKNAPLSNTNISMVGYEAPALVMIYIPFSDSWVSNTSLGISADMLNTDLIIRDGDLIVKYIRNNWVSGSLVANTGIEYRTKKNGSLYLGLSFHQPFKNLIHSESTLGTENIKYNISGAYLTIDLKYFFNNSKKSNLDITPITE